MIAIVLIVILALAFVTLVAWTLGVPLRGHPPAMGTATRGLADAASGLRAPARLLLALLAIAVATALLVSLMFGWVGKLLQDWLS